MDQSTLRTFTRSDDGNVNSLYFDSVADCPINEIDTNRKKIIRFTNILIESDA